MATISKYETERYITKIFREYISVLKKAKQYNKEQNPQTDVLFKNITYVEHLINSTSLKQNIYDRLNHEGLKQLFSYTK